MTRDTDGDKAIITALKEVVKVADNYSAIDAAKLVTFKEKLRAEKDKLTNYKSCDMTIVQELTGGTGADDATKKADAYKKMKKVTETLRANRQYYSLAEENGWTSGN